MTHHRVRPRARSVRGYAALGLTTALACAARPASEPAAPMRPSAAVAEPAGEATVPTRVPPATDSPKSNETVDKVVTLIAKPGLWPLDADAARRVLQALGPVKREQQSADGMSLTGGVGEVGSFDVDYSLEDERYWVFDSAGFFLNDRDLGRLYRSVEARLRQLLGKPTWKDAERGSEELPAVGWDLGEAITLSLAPRTEGDGQGIEIAIREGSGGPR